jgi:hypothetical protein
MTYSRLHRDDSKNIHHVDGEIGGMRNACRPEYKDSSNVFEVPGIYRPTPGIAVAVECGRHGVIREN